MADISKIQLPNSDLYDIKDAVARSSTEIIIGTQTAATNIWTGEASFSTLESGQTITYWLPYAGTSSSASMNLTLADGTATGNVNVYINGSTRCTTHIAAGNFVQMVYLVNARVGSKTYTGWWINKAQDTTTNYYDRSAYKASVTSTESIAAGKLGVFDENGLLIPLGQMPFDITKPILYVGTAYTSKTHTNTNNYICWGTAFSLATTVAEFEGTAGATVYIKGTLSGNMLTPVSEVLTCAQPSFDDGYVYMLLGLMSTSVNAVLPPAHPLFAYKNGGFKSVCQLALETFDTANEDTDNLAEWLAVTSLEDIQLKNMIDTSSSDFLIGKGFSGTTGTIVTSAIHLITNYIPVLKGQKVAVWYRNTNMLTTGQTDYNKIAFYDANKNWLSTVNIKETPYSTSEVDFGLNGFIRIQIAPTDSPISANGLLCLVRNAGWRKNVVYQPTLGSGYNSELYDIVPNNFVAGGGDGSWVNQPQRYSQMLRLNHGSKVIYDHSVLNIWYVLYTVKSDGTRGSWFAEISSTKAHTPNDCNYEITIDTEGAERWVLLKAANIADSSYSVDQNELQNHVTILNRKNIYDVVLLMGQSNAAGRGVTSTAQPEAAPALIRGAGIEFRAISDTSRFYAIAEPFGVAENNSSGIDDGNMKTGSMMTSFTNEYFSRTGFPVIGISASKGGTTISQWQPNGALLTDAIARLTACKTFAANNGYTLRHIYMIWCQGESDGDAGTTAASYISQFNTMFAAMQDAGVEKCFLCRIGEYNGTGSTDYSEIILAQNALARSNPDVIMGTTALAGYRSRGLMNDDFHYYQAAYNEMGRLIADTMAEYQKTGREPMMYDPKTKSMYFSYDTSTNSGEDALSSLYDANASVLTLGKGTSDEVTLTAAQLRQIKSALNIS